MVPAATETLLIARSLNSLTHGGRMHALRIVAKARHRPPKPAHGKPKRLGREKT